MLLDWLVFGLLVFGVAKLLNATAFKAKPASSSATWGLTIAAFFLNLVALSFIKVLRYKAISDSLGGTIFPDNPIDWIGAFAFTTLFFSFLRREQKKQTTASPQERDIKEPKPHALPQDIPSNTKPHPEENGGPSIPNSSHKNHTPEWRTKFLILLMGFLVAGVVGGIGLIYLFSDSQEDARKKLTEMNIAFNEKSFFDRIDAEDVYVVRLFLKSGINPNIKDKDKYTAIMRAAMKGNSLIIKELINYGADVNIVHYYWMEGSRGPSEGEAHTTALDHAEFNDHKNAVTILKTAGALSYKNIKDRKL